METKQNSSPSVQVQNGSGSYPARNYLKIGKPNNFIKEEPRPPPTVRTVSRQPEFPREVQSPEQRRNLASTSTSVISYVSNLILWNLLTELPILRRVSETLSFSASQTITVLILSLLEHKVRPGEKKVDGKKTIDNKWRGETGSGLMEKNFSAAELKYFPQPLTCLLCVLT